MSLDPVPIKGVLSELGKRSRLGHPLETGFVWTHWREIVGDAIADHARPSSLREGVLRVRAESSVWATEIGYMAEDIRRLVNEALEGPLVREIKVWTAADGLPGEPHKPPDRAASEEPRRAPVRDVPADPQAALERARAAWARRAARGRGKRL